jgi:hypothetical protein
VINVVDIANLVYRPERSFDFSKAHHSMNEHSAAPVPENSPLPSLVAPVSNENGGSTGFPVNSTSPSIVPPPSLPGHPQQSKPSFSGKPVHSLPGISSFPKLEDSLPEYAEHSPNRLLCPTPSSDNKYSRGKEYYGNGFRLSSFIDSSPSGSRQQLMNAIGIETPTRSTSHQASAARAHANITAKSPLRPLLPLPLPTSFTWNHIPSSPDRPLHRTIIPKLEDAL